MKDSEIGELWHDANNLGGHWESVGAAEVIKELVRRLVHERACRVAMEYYRINTAPTLDEAMSCVAAACRDFGIDPEEYNP